MLWLHEADRDGGSDPAPPGRSYERSAGVGAEPAE